MAFSTPVEPDGRVTPVTIDHLAPFQCSISGSLSMLPGPGEPFALSPTAQALPVLSSSTPDSPAWVPLGIGAGTRVQAVPSQCSTRGWPTALAARNEPTAQPSVALPMDTLANPLSVTRCGCGFSLGTTCQMPLAAAARAPLATAALAPPAVVPTSRHAAAPTPSTLRITCVSSVVARRASGPGHTWKRQRSRPGSPVPAGPGAPGQGQPSRGGTARAPEPPSPGRLGPGTARAVWLPSRGRRYGRQPGRSSPSPPRGP